MRKILRKYEGKGYSFELEAEVPFCPKCGRQLVSGAIEEEIRERANAIIRQQRDIIIVLDLEHYGIHIFFKVYQMQNSLKLMAQSKTSNNSLGIGEVTLFCTKLESGIK